MFFQIDQTLVNLDQVSKVTVQGELTKIYLVGGENILLEDKDRVFLNKLSNFLKMEGQLINLDE